MKKTVLIIGSSGGLGSSIADKFDTNTYNIALHYFTNKPAIEEGESIKLYQADITNEGEVELLVERVVSDYNTIDIVVNNAGVSISEISWKANLSNWDKTIAVNLTGPFLVTKHVLPHMRKSDWGRIIFVSSIVAQTGFAGTSAYAASKAGLLGLTKSLAKEVASKNITVNTIALGYFNAGMIKDVPEQMKSEIIESIPKNKLGDPLQLLETIRFIIAENSSYLTGQTINLNGGLYM